ncbi:hypothetical protein H310_00113 [Aphanomyces invadans]|uniref:Protein SERAC1 n=1 Tax=Aphanomyces invadans TaxID=157072 RepID=A0A024UUG6_9STRA|nr:hypothetical protein H310_00113 [Aphanomyces invadans]ETW09562.1 hypothetical protein H310_00113 [Aphanomyces invadans]|eukprot:XP_008860973.1 hypothetical protein H310_00113 [Aphanomyces invadans]
MRMRVPAASRLAKATIYALRHRGAMQPCHVRALSSVASSTEAEPGSHRWVARAAAGAAVAGAALGAYTVIFNDDNRRSLNAVVSLGKVLTDIHGASDALDAVSLHLDDQGMNSNCLDEHASSILVAIAKEKMFRDSVVEHGGLAVLMDTCAHTSEPKLQERIVQAIAALANTKGADEVLADIDKSSYLLLQLTPSIVHRQPHDPRPVAIAPLDLLKLEAAFTRIREKYSCSTFHPELNVAATEAVLDRLTKVITGSSSTDFIQFSMWAMRSLLTHLECTDATLFHAMGLHLNIHLSSALFAMAKHDQTSPGVKLHAANLLATMLRSRLQPIAPRVWCEEVAIWARDASADMQLLSAQCLELLAKQVPAELAHSSTAHDALLHLARNTRNTSAIDHPRAVSASTTAIQIHVSSAVHALADVLQTGLHTTVQAPMAKVLGHLDDVMPDAHDYDVLPKIGWVDVLAEWSVSSHPTVCANAIQSLARLAMQPRQDDRSKQVLQAWMLGLLRHLASIKATAVECRRAVANVEGLVNMTHDQTPGYVHVPYRSQAIENGLAALAVLVNDDATTSDVFVTHGGLELVALTAIMSSSKAIKTQCARVVANVAVHHHNIQRQLQDVLGGDLFTQDILHWEDEPNVVVRSSYYRAAANFAAATASTTGHPTEFYKDGLHPIVSRPAANTTSTPPIDVVLVHGLRGHPFGTWRTSMSVSGNDVDILEHGKMWPEAFLMPDLNPDSRVVTMGYDAGMSKWSSPWRALTLDERAAVMLDALQTARIGANGRPVVFITHSMGGLLVKEMLSQATGAGLDIARQTVGVVFLAVPHFGANLATLNNETLRNLVQAHPATKHLNENNSRLAQLNAAFEALQIPSLSLGEGAPAPLGLGVSHLVVKPESADPHIPLSTFHMIPHAHHMDICKPPTPADPRYSLIRDFILQHVQHPQDAVE